MMFKVLVLMCPGLVLNVSLLLSIILALLGIFNEKLL